MPTSAVWIEHPGDSRHRILVLPPQGYLSMVALMREATAVLTAQVACRRKPLPLAFLA
jgi:hypothetical protein